MRADNQKAVHCLLSLCALWMLMLGACGSASSNSAATPDVDAIYTSAYETFSVQKALALSATLPMSKTPLPMATATTPTPTPLLGGHTTCDNSAYVSDVTIADGTVIAAGSKFVKTWLLQNTGSCTWTTGYRLSFYGGDPMGGTDAVVVVPVPPGSLSEFSVNLTAPASVGIYTGRWQMKNEEQVHFGNIMTVVINVGSPTECRRSSRTTVTISGHAGPENVTIQYGDGMTVTDAHGNYAFTVPEGWSGTVTPSKAKVNPWTFSPEHRTYTNVTCDLRHEDYKATAPPGV